MISVEWVSGVDIDLPLTFNSPVCDVMKRN
jgi:hypothetical protein